MDIFKRLWARMNEPKTERVLIILIPCFTLFVIIVILAPTVLALLESPPAAIAPPSVSVSPEILPAETSHIPDAADSDPSGEIFFETEQEDASSDDLSTEMNGWYTISGETCYLQPDGSLAVGLRQIDGKLCYFNSAGIKAKALGIDVSFYNDRISWESVKAQGIDFAIIRTGYRGWETGLLHEDDCFRRNITGAVHAGVDVGVYFFSTAVTPAEAAEEAGFVISCLDGQELAYPVYMDIEQSGMYPYGRSDRLNKAARMATIEAFCKVITDNGYEAGVYSSKYFLENNLPLEGLSRYDVWLANYTRNNRMPDFSGRYDMWQFTETGFVSGVNGIVDMNVVY